MRFRHHDPDARLRDLVQGYWELEELHLAGPEQNYDLPERTVRLIFSAGRALMGPSLERLRPVPPVMLTSFSVTPQSNTVQGQLRVLVAELYPWGAKQLLGWNAEDAPGRLDAALSDAAWGREVVALLASDQWDAARQCLEQTLISLARQPQGEPGKGVQAALQIYRSLGTSRVADLAETLGLSPRTLERQFVQQVGVGAKTLARVVRFDELHSRIRQDPAVPVAELTYQLGFFDQAHLIKEFRALSSMTPGAFAAIVKRRMRATIDPLRTGDQVFGVTVPPDFGLDPA